MKMRDILSRKGHQVVSVAPDRTVADALDLLVEHGIGSLMVLDGDEVEGIITERDVLRLANRDPAGLASTRVADAMTRDLLVAVPDDDVHYVMGVMTRHRVRHLPVVNDGSLEGIVSIGDLVNELRERAEQENRYLKDYVQGLVR